jgi:perosamine synthetase
MDLIHSFIHSFRPFFLKLYKAKISKNPMDSEEHDAPIHIAKPLITNDEKQAVMRILDSGMLAQGEEVTKFEDEFKNFIGSKHAIATSNGTTALHATLLAHDIKSGDEVITTSFSFIATANVIKFVGATPIFCDINPITFNIDPQKIESKITNRTKAIMPVHLYGQPANMKAIQQIADKHNLIIIEDAAQAHGAEYQNQNNQTKSVGSEHTACFSFYPTKNITTGEGGIITTNDDKLATTLRKIITHGSNQRYHHDMLGHNFRMTNIAAAIGRVQLEKLPQFNQQRITNANLLNQNLANNPLIQVPQTKAGHVFHQYCIRVKNGLRDSLITFLKEKKIASQIYYPIPIHKQLAYERYNHQFFPNSEQTAKEILALPIHPSVTELQIQRITNTINQWTKQQLMNKSNQTKGELQ